MVFWEVAFDNQPGEGDRNNAPVVGKSTEIIKARGKVHANEYL